jgi:hypothetical protein
MQFGFWAFPLMIRVLNKGEKMILQVQ